MLIIKTNQPNTLVVTVSQNSELTNPEYLFSFTHIFSKQNITFIPTDISTFKSRYDEFFFVEGTGVGKVAFPYQGQFLYTIYEQPAGSGNLNPALAYNVVENGDAQVFPASASTMDSQYDIYISNNEDNANIIFAPDELNPPPSPSPSANPTSTPTNTPSVTPTNTPTNTQTSTQTNTPTNTPSVTQTSTPTNTPSVTQTSTPTNTQTNTPTNTPSVTQTQTQTPTQTQTQTQTPTTTTTLTATPTGTSTPTPTPTVTQTQTPTQTATQTGTPTPTPSATPFNPSTIADLYQWFDTSVGSNITTRESGGETFVESWTGRTGGYSVSQSNASNQPKLVAGAFGLPYSGITFSGATDFLSGLAGNIAIPTGNTTFVVGYILNTTNELLCDISASGGTSETVTSLYSNANIIQMRSVGGSMSVNNWGTRPKYPKLLGATSGNTSTRSGMINDIGQTSTGAFTSGNNYATIRFSTDVGIAPSNGTIFEYIVYNRVLTQAQANSVLEYLKDKWDYNNW